MTALGEKGQNAASAAGSVIREMKWGWRRLLTFLVVVMCLSLIAVIVGKLDDPAALKNLAQWLIGLVALSITYYLIGPTAEHIVAAVQAFRQGREPD